MSKYGKDRKRAEKRAINETHQPRDARAGDYQRPDREQCEHRYHYEYLNDNSTLRLTFRQWRTPNGMADFSLSLERALWDLDDLHVIAQADCCHGNCHVHLPESQPYSETELIYRLDTIHDVKAAANKARARLTQIAEDYIENEGNR